MADKTISQTIQDAEIDARSLSEFIYKPADYMVSRRLSTNIHTLNYYLQALEQARSGMLNASMDQLINEIDLRLSATTIGGLVYSTPQEGIAQGVKNGEYYNVRSNNDDYYVEEYKNNNGSPQATGKKYPSAKHLAERGNHTALEAIQISKTRAIGQKFYTHGFYNKGDCPPTVFTLSEVDGTEGFVNIGSEIFIGKDASVKVDDTKKLVVERGESLALSQLGGVKSDVSVHILNEVVASVILANFKELVLDGFYNIMGTIWHGRNNVIRGIGKKLSGIKMTANRNKHPIQSIDSNIKEAVILNNYLELCHFTLDGNESENNVRDYSKDINKSYWGFGAALFNIDYLYIHDIHVANTDAWGISFHLCNVVRGEDLTFDQKAETGGNKDGITGSGRRVTFRNLSGYTSDDLCAAGVGKSTLQGYDCGVTARIDVEYVYIDGLEGIEKSGHRTHYAAGIYGTDNANINNIYVANVKGSFHEGTLRFANYWFAGSLVNFRKIEVKNIAKTKTNNPSGTQILLNRISCSQFIVDGITYEQNGDISSSGGPVLIQSNASQVGSVSINNVDILQKNTTQNISIVGVTTSDIKQFSFDNIRAHLDVTSPIAPSLDNLSSGTFAFVSKIEQASARKLSVRNFLVTNYNQAGLWLSLVYAMTEGVTVNIDNIEANAFISSLFSFPSSVTLDTSYANRCYILDSQLHLNIRLIIGSMTNVSQSADTQLMTPIKLRYVLPASLPPISKLAIRDNANTFSSVLSLTGAGLAIKNPALTGYPTQTERDAITGAARLVVNLSVPMHF